MKDIKNIGYNDAALRIIVGVMIFILIWFEMLGRIIMNIPLIGKIILIIISVSLLITGSSGISPLYAIIGVNTRKL